jgi:hypothetical protein
MFAVSKKDKNNFNPEINGNTTNKRAALNVKRIALLRLKNQLSEVFSKAKRVLKVGRAVRSLPTSHPFQ